MALRAWTEKGYVQLTNKQIKEAIMARWGLDPKNPQDQQTYKRRYDVYALRVKNYSKLINVSSPIRSNESLLRTLQREQNGAPLTAEQIGILNTPAQNIKKFGVRLQREDKKLTQLGITNLEKLFEQFLLKNTHGYLEQYIEFSTQENIVTSLVNPDGEIIATYESIKGETVPTDIQEGFKLDTYSTRELRPDLTVEEVKKFLEARADELHAWQEQRMLANGGISKKMRKQIGS